MPSEFIQNAKQILRGKDHIADCIDADTAEMIVQALNDRDEICIERAVGQRQIDELSNQPQRIAAYLDTQADKRARRRQFTQGIRFAAQEVRARMWEADEEAPEGVRARYNDDGGAEFLGTNWET